MTVSASKTRSVRLFTCHWLPAWLLFWITQDAVFELVRHPPADWKDPFTMSEGFEHAIYTRLFLSAPFFLIVIHLSEQIKIVFFRNLINCFALSVSNFFRLIVYFSARSYALTRNILPSYVEAARFTSQRAFDCVWTSWVYSFSDLAWPGLVWSSPKSAKVVNYRKFEWLIVYGLIKVEYFISSYHFVRVIL
jgi:hypothetical protein